MDRIERWSIDLSGVSDDLIYVMDLTSLYKVDTDRSSLQRATSCSGEVLLGSHPQQSIS